MSGYDHLSHRPSPTPPPRPNPHPYFKTQQVFFSPRRNTIGHVQFPKIPQAHTDSTKQISGARERYSGVAITDHLVILRQATSYSIKKVTAALLHSYAVHPAFRLLSPYGIICN